MAQLFLSVSLGIIIVTASCLTFLGIVDLVSEAIQKRREDK